MAKRQKTENTMTKRKKTENTIAKRQTTENTMAKRQKAKGTNNNLYNTIQKTKDRVTRTPLKNRG
jgi:hypothetical protein